MNAPELERLLYFSQILYLFWQYNWQLLLWERCRAPISVLQSFGGGGVVCSVLVVSWVEETLWSSRHVFPWAQFGDQYLVHMLLLIDVFFRRPGPSSFPRYLCHIRGGRSGMGGSFSLLILFSPADHKSIIALWPSQETQPVYIYCGRKYPRTCANEQSRKTVRLNKHQRWSIDLNNHKGVFL